MSPIAPQLPFYEISFTIFFSLNAFNMTVKLLNTIAKLAHIGFIAIPIGFSIPIAIGIINEL